MATPLQQQAVTSDDLTPDNPAVDPTGTLAACPISAEPAPLDPRVAVARGALVLGEAVVMIAALPVLAGIVCAAALTSAGASSSFQFVAVGVLVLGLGFTGLLIHLQRGEWPSPQGDAARWRALAPARWVALSGAAAIVIIGLLILAAGAPVVVGGPFGGGLLLPSAGPGAVALAALWYGAILLAVPRLLRMLIGWWARTR